MTSRLSSDERRAQVARVALELLAGVSPERLTTRAVAAAAGVSQPALFRHFDSREAILEAAVAFASDQLEVAAASAIPPGAPPRAAIHALVETLFDFAATWPGLPRLFFYQAAEFEANPSVRGPLERLVQRQRRLVVEWLGAAALPIGLDTERAAELLVATVQGELLRARTQPADDSRAARVASLVGHFWAGLEAGAPARLVPPARDRARAPGIPLQTLDTRPLLAAGVDPFESVMAAVENLGDEGCLLLVVPFRPTPLISVLQARGLGVALLAEAPLVLLLVSAPGAPDFHDLIDLEAPEPLEFVLRSCAALAPGASLLARLPRHPALLLPRLAERGLAFEHAAIPGSGAVLLFVRAPRSSDV